MRWGREQIESIQGQILQWIGNEALLPLQLDLTNACNLRCIHCYHPHHRNEGALSLHDWFRLIGEFNELVSTLQVRPWFVLAGGEPLVSPFFWPILDEIRSANPQAEIKVLSNGTMIDQARAKRLAGFHPTFQISIDGPTTASHDLIRGSGNLARALAGVRELVEQRIPVHLAAVLSGRSAPWIGEFFDLAASIGASSMNFHRLIPQGQAKALIQDGEDRPLEANELRAAYTEILRNSARTGVRTYTAHPLMHLIHPALGANGRFGEGLVIDYQGYALASSRSRLRIAHTSKAPLRKILLESPLLKAVRAGASHGCGDCPDFLRCGGDRNAAYAATGDYLAKDPACWRKD